jgi:hypothetical protein
MPVIHDLTTGSLNGRHGIALKVCPPDDPAEAAAKYQYKDHQRPYAQPEPVAPRFWRGLV